ncbi:hypothetical protein B0H13DRAFT_1911829 [Mycena leptocephala]|nr:hypothetical protein B0H13DRAFT_1911829 [Mycena leptocephala]
MHTQFGPHFLFSPLQESSVLGKSGATCDHLVVVRNDPKNLGEVFEAIVPVVAEILRSISTNLSALCRSSLSRKKSGDEAHLDFPEYDANHWISANFAYQGRPTDFRPIATDDLLADTFKYNEIIARWREIGIGATARKHSCGHAVHTPVSCEASPPGIPSRSSDSLAAGDTVCAAGFKATLQAIESVIKKTATRCSMHVLAARMGETQGPVDDFFVKEEERALSEASYGSMPGLVTPPASSASE